MSMSVIPRWKIYLKKQLISPDFLGYGFSSYFISKDIFHTLKKPARFMLLNKILTMFTLWPKEYYWEECENSWKWDTIEGNASICYFCQRFWNDFDYS